MKNKAFRLALGIAAIGFAALSLAACPNDTTSPTHTHQWGEWTVTTAATCTTAGVETRVCSLDASHKETRDIAVNPDAHNWGNWVETIAPTLTTAGEAARTCKDNTEHTETWPRAIPMTAVPGGSFEMGKELGTAGLGNITPVHTVTLTGFSIGKYAVTQAQYQAVMGSNPSDFSSNPASGEIQGNRPVEQVRWYETLVFCNKLSVMEGLSPAYRINGSTDPAQWGTVPTANSPTWNAVAIVAGSDGYRLPTEAQWEYAAKGGNSPGNYTYAGSNTVGNVAWYSDNSGSKTHEVGKKSLNGLGLYDMSGNVFEWCWDWDGDYSAGAQTNPTGSAGPALESYPFRVHRGGSYLNAASGTRSVSRIGLYPYTRSNLCGFRLVRP